MLIVYPPLHETGMQQDRFVRSSLAGDIHRLYLTESSIYNKLKFAVVFNESEKGVSVMSIHDHFGADKLQELSPLEMKRIQGGDDKLGDNEVFHSSILDGRVNPGDSVSFTIAPEGEGEKRAIIVDPGDTDE